MPDAVVDTEDEAPTRRRRRRWPFVLAGVVLLLGLVAAGLWFLWLPNWRPSLHRGESYGIDVSAHQKTIDWKRVASDNIHFAYIKATEGGDFTDDRFNDNWRGAQATGLARGAYHFFTLCTSGVVQADHFLAVAPPDAAALPERSTSSSRATAASARMQPQSIRSWTHFCSELSRRGDARLFCTWATISTTGIPSASA